MANNSNDVRLIVLIKLQEAIVEEACLEEQFFGLMYRFAERFTNRRVEINRLMTLHGDPLIDYGICPRVHDGGKHEEDCSLEKRKGCVAKKHERKASTDQGLPRNVKALLLNTSQFAKHVCPCPNGRSGGLIEGRFGESCGGNDGRGGSITEMGGGRVDSICGIRGGEVNGEGVDLEVSKRLLLEVAREMIGESGGIEVGEVGGGDDT
nr:hypothetical protein [Tanacetum cinerariifolium]